MVKKKKITRNEVEDFIKTLNHWTFLETSYFFKQFRQTFGMSEMQFYTRLYKAKEFFIDFNYREMKRNLRRNRFLRETFVKEFKKNAEKIIVDFKESESTTKKISQNAQKGRGI